MGTLLDGSLSGVDAGSSDASLDAAGAGLDTMVIVKDAL